MNEPLIKIKPETDFEKLLYAQHEIKELYKKVKELNIEIGILISERDEYKDQLNKYLNHTIKRELIYKILHR